MDLTLAVLILSVALIVAGYFYYKLYKKAATLSAELSQTRQRYAPIINVDAVVAERKQEALLIEQSIHQLRTDFVAKRAVYDSLLRETAIYESKLEDISFGVYEPIYNYSTSEEYKAKLEAIRIQVKELIKDDRAVYSAVEWSVGGSKVEGRRMMKQYSKLMLRAFNGECDSAIARVNWNNMGNMEARISKSFEAINKLGSVNQISITQPYHDLRKSELQLEFELQQKIQSEKEEQRLIREQMREEEKAQREIEIAQRKAEDEEARYQKALLKATEDAKRATGAQLESLDLKIAELEQLLAAAQLQKERALSMAQQTKSGHVYVISNIGSFGEDVFKIGMTRRLEPMDRVKELGDASVPFSFDVHALVYSDNAPELEYRIHRQLMERRLNLINNRREFFRVDLDEVESIFSNAGHPLTLTRLAEAREYRESLAIRESKSRVGEEIESDLVADPIPMSLDD
jgi:hypothetical protein